MCKRKYSSIIEENEADSCLGTALQQKSVIFLRLRKWRRDGRSIVESSSQSPRVIVPPASSWCSDFLVFSGRSLSGVVVDRYVIDPHFRFALFRRETKLDARKRKLPL